MFFVHYIAEVLASPWLRVNILRAPDELGLSRKDINNTTRNPSPVDHPRKVRRDHYLGQTCARRSRKATAVLTSPEQSPI